MTDLTELEAAARTATPQRCDRWTDHGIPRETARFIALVPPERVLALIAVARAAEDIYRIAVGGHGHDETHSADWPACLPAHMAMNRYRAALAALEGGAMTPTTDSLGAAWAEAEAALPDRYTLEVHRLSERRGTRLLGWVTYDPPTRPGGRGRREPRWVIPYGPDEPCKTFADALRALTTTLRERKP